MLRSGDTIRLTPKELSSFADMAVDSSKPPTTVQEHDARLDLAAKVWAEGESAEEQMMAVLASGMKIEQCPAAEQSK